MSAGGAVGAPGRRRGGRARANLEVVEARVDVGLRAERLDLVGADGGAGMLEEEVVEVALLVPVGHHKLRGKGGEEGDVGGVERRDAVRVQREQRVGPLAEIALRQRGHVRAQPLFEVEVADWQRDAVRDTLGLVVREGARRYDTS